MKMHRKMLAGVGAPLAALASCFALTRSIPAPTIAAMAAVLQYSLGITVGPVRCTKIAAKLIRTFTDRHGLKDLCKELLGVDLSKQQQTSDWGALELTSEQCAYAASDVLYLHALWAKLEAALVREGRLDLAEACFEFLPTRCRLDLLGYEDPDIFHH